jgi:hypothetical protein
METRLRSGTAKTRARTAAAKPKPAATEADASELLLAELTARRARLRELLQLIRREAARNLEISAPQRACKPLVADLRVNRRSRPN